MATTTPNYGWVVPTSTDLVKDGATAIETLGDGIDASFVGLKGGTTGQVLSKTSGTDLAFTWVAQDDLNAIQNAIVDAKGDLIAATAADTPARLAVGTNGQVLTADSTASTGIKWATPATSSSGLTLITTQSFSAASTVSVNDVFSTNYDYYKVAVSMIGSGAISINGRLRVSGADNSSTNYNFQRFTVEGVNMAGAAFTGQTNFEIADVKANDGVWNLEFTNPFGSKTTQIYTNSIPTTAGHIWWRNAYFNATTSFTGFSLVTTSGTVTGTLSVWGYSK